MSQVSWVITSNYPSRVTNFCNRFYLNKHLLIKTFGSYNFLIKKYFLLYNCDFYSAVLEKCSQKSILV